jgi:sugar phosphate permease
MFLPVLGTIVSSYGWRTMGVAVATIALALFPLVALLMRDRPADLGLAPYGDDGRAAAPSSPSPRLNNPIAAAFKALGVALRSRNFWLLAASYFICGASTSGLIGTHLIPACIDHGIADVTGANLLASMAIFNFIGTTGSGWLSDRIDNRTLLAIYYTLRGLSLLYLPFSFVSFYGLSLFVVFYGLDWIATVPPTIRLTANIFGKENVGMMFGWMSVSHQLGGALAAFLGGLLRMDLGSYLEAFILAGVLCFIAAFLVLFIGVDREASDRAGALAT